MSNNTMSEELRENILNEFDFFDKGRDGATDRIMKSIEKYTLSKQIEARLDEAEEMWEKFDGYYADADRLCDYAVERIAELRKQQEELK